ncbi:hypothetical protein NL676_001753 [Syzygium grande]|nr:hypothetical protein NL676_001753 [Syzygium grande]
MADSEWTGGDAASGTMAPRGGDTGGGGLAKEHKRGQGCCIGLGLGIAQALNFDGRSNKALRLDLVKDGVVVPVNLRKKERDDGM